MLLKDRPLEHNGGIRTFVWFPGRVPVRINLGAISKADKFGAASSDPSKNTTGSSDDLDVPRHTLEHPKKRSGSGSRFLRHGVPQKSFIVFWGAHPVHHGLYGTQIVGSYS